MNESNYLQEYFLHLVNGEKVKVAEQYDLPKSERFIVNYENGSENRVFTFGDAVTGFIYVPKSAIVYVSTGDAIKEEDVTEAIMIYTEF